MSADIIEKVTIMRYDYDSTEILRQESLEPPYCIYIEVVCRLIEQNYIRVAEKRLCKEDLDLFVAR